MMHLKRIALPAGFAALAISQAAAQPAAPVPVARNGEKPRNVIFILSDDHRYDFMGFTGAVPWLQTPALDRMAREGACLKNAFVTTSLSSPSRASILTGLFTHTHTVVDNQAPKPDDLVFFPQYLQQNGYRTAFFGKWHMGNQDDMPQPGFDHWEGFRGQGTYYNTVLNINGERVKFDPELYSTDILTDHAIDFVRDNEEGPFFIYLSYKSVHSGCQPFFNLFCGHYIFQSDNFCATFFRIRKHAYKVFGAQNDIILACGRFSFGYRTVTDFLDTQPHLLRYLFNV